ncbi:MAG TPA: hypothetical protein VGQ57_01630 [Polyangiaceae bacterium]|jgi:hypothetical protein|nr:hypothetical protein [Polyangiaceae bacterium]
MSSLLTEQRHFLGRRLSDALVIYLRQAGFRVTRHELRRPLGRSVTKIERDDSGIDSKGDALLEVSLERAGYLTLGRGYVPWLFITARLLESRSRRLLSAGQFSYGADITLDDVDHIASDRRYRYSDFDALTDHAEDAARGLTVGLPLVARRIVSELVSFPQSPGRHG